MSTTWVVHKFGGTSVTDAGRASAGLLPIPRRHAFSDLLRLTTLPGAPQ